MKIGVYIFPTEYSISIVDLGCELEDRGFESLFVPEHTHIPASRKTPFPSGGLLPKEYSHTLDPFVALAAVAARTKKLRIGTGICLLTERDPIVTAKIVASLDQVSNGRFELGLGAGWNAEEMENHGTTYEHRFQIMVARAKAMQAISMQEENLLNLILFGLGRSHFRSRTHLFCLVERRNTHSGGLLILPMVGSLAAVSYPILNLLWTNCDTMLTKPAEILDL